MKKILIITIIASVIVVAGGYILFKNMKVEKSPRTAVENSGFASALNPISGQVVAEKLPETNPFNADINPFDLYKNPFKN